MPHDRSSSCSDPTAYTTSALPSAAPHSHVHTTVSSTSSTDSPATSSYSPTASSSEEEDEFSPLERAYTHHAVPRRARFAVYGPPTRYDPNYQYELADDEEDEEEEDFVGRPTSGRGSIYGYGPGYEAGMASRPERPKLHLRGSSMSLHMSTTRPSAQPLGRVKSKLKGGTLLIRRKSEKLAKSLKFQRGSSSTSNMPLDRKLSL